MHLAHSAFSSSFMLGFAEVRDCQNQTPRRCISIFVFMFASSRCREVMSFVLVFIIESMPASRRVLSGNDVAFDLVFVVRSQLDADDSAVASTCISKGHGGTHFIQIRPPIQVSTIPVVFWALVLLV